MYNILQNIGTPVCQFLDPPLSTLSYATDLFNTLHLI